MEAKIKEIFESKDFIQVTPCGVVINLSINEILNNVIESIFAYNLSLESVIYVSTSVYEMCEYTLIQKAKSKYKRELSSIPNPELKEEINKIKTCYPFFMGFKIEKADIPRDCIIAYDKDKPLTVENCVIYKPF